MGIKANPDGKTATVTPGAMKSGSARDSGRVTQRTQPNAQPIAKSSPNRTTTLRPVPTRKR